MRTRRARRERAAVLRALLRRRRRRRRRRRGGPAFAARARRRRRALTLFLARVLFRGAFARRRAARVSLRGARHGGCRAPDLRRARAAGWSPRAPRRARSRFGIRARAPSSARRPARGARSRRRRLRAASSRTPPSPRCAFCPTRARRRRRGSGLARRALERARARRDARRRRRRLGRRQGRVRARQSREPRRGGDRRGGGAGGASLAPGPAAGGAFGPTIALTASDAPCDGFVRLWDAPGRGRPRRRSRGTPGSHRGVAAMAPARRRGRRCALAGRSGAFLTGDGAGVVRAWDWRRAGGALASARAHAGAVTAVTALDDSRADVAGSAGEDGAVRAIALGGGGGRGRRRRLRGRARVPDRAPRPRARARGRARRRRARPAEKASTRAWPTTRALAGAYDADGAADGAADATLLRAGGVGLVSGGDDGAVRLWAPGSGALSDGYPRGEDTGSSWACVGRAHAHGGGVCLVEVGKSSRRASPSSPPRRTLFRGVVGAVAAALGVAAWGAPGGGGGADPRRAPYRSNSGKHRGAPFAPVANTHRGDDRGFAERGLSRRGGSRTARRRGCDGRARRRVPRWRGAGGRPSACTTAPRATPRARGGPGGGW